MTPEQQKAIAIANARRRMAQAGGMTAPTQKPIQQPQQETIAPASPRMARAMESREERQRMQEELKASIPEYMGETKKLQEIGAAPELNEANMRAFKASAAASLIGSDFELAKALAEQVPGIRFSRDKDVNLIATMPSGDSYYLNAPGISGQDLIKFGTRFGGYALGGGATTLPLLAAKSAGTEALLQGAESQLGGEFNASDVAIAGAAAPLGQVVGEKVIAPAVSRGAEALKTVAAGGRQGRSNLQAAVDDFAEFGDVPTLGTATGGRFRQGFENLSSRFLGGGPIRDAISKTGERMQQRLATIADDISPVSGEMEAGRAIQRGISGPGGFTERFMTKSGALWSKFDDMIGADAQVTASNTAGALDDLVKTSEVGKILNNPLLVRMKDAISSTGGQISYKELRDLRSMVGRRLGSGDLVSDIPRAELKQMYGAISRDLESLANAQGGEAMAAWSRANKYTSAGHGRIGDFVDRIAKKVDLDKVFNAVAKGGEGTQAINAIKRSLKPDEWNVVASNVVRRLGRATAGQQDDIGEAFSVNKFLTDWNKLGKSKEAIFSGSKELNQYRASLDKIARAANSFKEASGEMANASGSGIYAANVAALGGLGGTALSGNLPGFGVVLGTIAGNRALAGQLFANPKFVQWLAEGVTAKSWPGHIGKLSSVAAASENSEEIMQFLTDLESMSQETQAQQQEPVQTAAQ